MRVLQKGFTLSKLRNKRFTDHALHKQEVSSILACVSAILEQTEFNDVVRNIYNIAKQIIGVSAGFVAILGEDRTTNKILFTDFGDIPFRIPTNVPLPVDGLHAHVYQTGQVFYENNFATSKWIKEMPAGHIPFENVMFIPLVDNEETAGLLGLVNKPSGFSEHDVTLGTAFGEFASIALSRKNMVDRLQTSEKRYRQLINISPDAIVIHIKGEIVFANTVAATLARLPYADSLVGTNIVDYVHTDDINRIVRRYNTEQQSEDPFVLHEITGVRADGSVVNLEVSIAPLVYKGKAAEMLVIRDVSERKKMQEEILRATKLESISILASGIAHDFNNILTVILGNLSIARIYAKDQREVSRKLGEIEHAALQTKELTQQLLAFAKGSPLIKRQASLEETLIEMVTFALSGTNVEPVYTFEDHLPAVNIDIGQFNQVVNNLVINAVQAMPNGGKLHLTVVLESLGQQTALLPAGDYAKVSFQDNGVGISADHLLHIFDPYFTTKEQGNGLGLATSYNIIKQHGGQITVESELGKGATFHVYLPVSHEEFIPAIDQTKILHGQGRILLMDDEYGVRKTAGEMLHILGYDVDYAVTGEEAVAFYLREQQRGATYDVVILDMTVRGGMGGQKAIDKLLRADPHVKAIISSGYTTAPLLTQYQKFGFKGAIYKPYRLEEISHVVSQVMLNEVK
ncbi:MAG: ATP-binding protein [Firmicutes bacterium]|nr:ATP-binding protein [Bacillota bacterium]